MRTVLLCLVLACMTSVWSLAGDKDKDSTRTVTGCLQKTDQAKEFLLLGNDGSSWEVRSDTVSLADHVGALHQAYEEAVAQ